MKLRLFVVAPLLLLISACGGGASSSTSLPLDRSAPEGPQSIARAADENESDARRLPISLPTPSSNDLLYVGNVGNNSITVYHHDANANAAPIDVIAGSKTQLKSPGQLSEDALGNLYVASGSSILVFAHGANGNVAPIRVLGGPATLIDGTLGVTVDKATGKIFVATNIPNAPEFSPNARLLRFPPNATGNTAPFASESLPDDGSPTYEIASDSTGSNVIVGVGGEIGAMGLGAGIYTLPKQFPGDSSTHPAALSVYANGIADDPATKSYVVSGNFDSCKGQSGININNIVANVGIIRLAEGTGGSAETGGYLPCKDTLAPAPISIITSAPNCGQLVLGYLRNIYAVCGSAINVYTHDSSGNVPPLRILSGTATRLNEPYGIYEGT